MFMTQFIVPILYDPGSCCKLFVDHGGEQAVKLALFTHQQSEVQALVQGHRDLQCLAQMS